MKKIFAIIVLLCGIVNCSFAYEKTVCDITCNSSVDGNWIYCNKTLYKCWGSLGWEEKDVRWDSREFAVPCDYSDPTSRIVGDYTYEIDVTYKSKYTIFGKNPLDNGVLMTEKNGDFCYACYGKYYSDSKYCDYINLEEAWCEWFVETQDEYNVEWVDFEDGGKCFCLNHGMAWNKDLHKCVPSETGDGVISDDRLKAAIEDMNQFFESAKSKTDVWKNADGGFNTARLASDATAGVILGTVGGVVSAKVIKKKQIEKGFGALNCVIGGQKVADWGDEFSVGLGK